MLHIHFMHINYKFISNILKLLKLNYIFQDKNFKFLMVPMSISYNLSNNFKFFN